MDRLTYLCYNNSDLIRDGIIPSKVSRTWSPGDISSNRIKNPDRGVSYKIEKDADGNVVSIKETKKLLPANKIKVEIDFSKVMKNAVTHPFQPGSLPLPGWAQVSVGGLLYPLGFGGLTSGTTEITFQILESSTKINKKIIVDRDLLDTGIWESSDGYPLSVFGIVKEHIVEELDESGNVISTYGQGIPFSTEQEEIIGQYSDGSYSGSPRKRIRGCTSSDGLFGVMGIASVVFEDVIYDDQEQLFQEIIKDEISYKFRADNADGKGNGRPYSVSEDPNTDATSRKIRIKTTNLAEGDVLYITYCFSPKKYLRQNLIHKGVVAQGNTIGIVGFVGAISSEVDAFNYTIQKWKISTSTSSNKLSFLEYDNYEDGNISSDIREIEGWRHSETISKNLTSTTVYAADYRGIVSISKDESQVLFPKSQIRDQDAFNSFLNDLYTNWVYDPTQSRNIEDLIDWEDPSSFLIDISDVCNSILYDNEKNPYHKPFAIFLSQMGKYDENNEDSGIGIIQLDIRNVATDLSMYDLSFSKFEFMNAQPLINYSCESPFDIRPYHYWSENYDAANDQPWTMYSRDYVENSFMEWRPDGGTIENYWKVETPYFCGDFSKKTRIYIERMGGTSLDNFSWVYVNTLPFVPHNITSDYNINSDNSIVVFNDSNFHGGLSYHLFRSVYYDNIYQIVEIDKNRTHVREEYSQKNDSVIGQNRMMGDSPTYSNGSPITYEIPEICGDEEKRSEFWFIKDFIKDTDASFYGLNFNDNPPKINIPTDWYIRRMRIKYSYKDLKYKHLSDSPISFYFEESETSIGNLNIYSDKTEKDGTVTKDILMRYYYGGPVQFLGDFWKYVKVESVESYINSPTEERNTKQLDINDYKIQEGQSSVIIDKIGRTLVFFSNSDTNNIDVAVTVDDGRRWYIHRSIVRLIENETATLPYAIKDNDSNFVHLFYILNDSFVMYKRVDTNLFVDKDAFIYPNVPSSYDVGDYDFSKEDAERSYWGDMSDYGLSLRRSPSYFVIGSAYDDSYFDDQIKISENLKKEYQDNFDPNNSYNGDPQNIQSPRFDYSGSRSSMEDSYDGAAYSIHIDSGGIVRIFFESSGKLSIKSSPNFQSWEYDAKEVSIHKIYKQEEKNTGISQDISNIQVVRNDYDATIISILYFNNDMLFVRHFDSNLLFPLPTYNNRNRDYIEKQLDTTEDSPNLPVFLIGNIPDQIWENKIKEIDNSIGQDDSMFYIKFPYSKDMLVENNNGSITKKMNENYAVDSSTQVFAFMEKTGIIRVFYKDSYDNLEALIIDSMERPTPECLVSI